MGPRTRSAVFDVSQPLVSQSYRGLLSLLGKTDVGAGTLLFELVYPPESRSVFLWGCFLGRNRAASPACSERVRRSGRTHRGCSWRRTSGYWAVCFISHLAAAAFGALAATLSEEETRACEAPTHSGARPDPPGCLSRDPTPAVGGPKQGAIQSK